MSESSPKPELSKPSNAWLVWIVPLIAVLVSGYILYRDFSGKGPLLNVSFADGSGIVAERTQVLYRGVVVGEVEAVELEDDMESVAIEIRLAKSAASLAREGSRIWIVRPEITASGVSGLATLVTGAYIEIDPGDGPPTSNFTGLDSAPRRDTNGRIFTLYAEKTGSIHKGVPVEFRGIVIGEVNSVSLAPDTTEVLVEIEVDSRYLPLVREGTVFWDAGGVNMKVGLLGAKIRTGSLSDVITGSISLANSPESAESPAAPGGHRFPLHSEPRDQWLQWNPPIPLEPGE
jgi:paraquat-inducible protein B